MVGTSGVMDLQEFCAKVLQDYEEVIATIIQRPGPSMSVRPITTDETVAATSVCQEPVATAAERLPEQTPITRLAA